MHWESVNSMTACQLLQHWHICMQVEMDVCKLMLHICMCVYASQPNRSCGKACLSTTVIKTNTYAIKIRNGIGRCVGNVRAHTHIHKYTCIKKTTLNHISSTEAQTYGYNTVKVVSGSKRHLVVVLYNSKARKIKKEKK